jgi:predicted RNase H-like HicB family nuclease
MKVTIHIKSDERGGFKAVCPTLPGCLTRAQTREEARNLLREAIKGYLAAIGNFVPENLDQHLVEA